MSGWPVVTYETLPWRSRYEPGSASRAAMSSQAGPYRAAIPPLIATTALDLPAATAAAAEDAAVEIARFDAEMGAEIAPFQAVLLRTESAASSQIEHLTASARAIAEAAVTPSTVGPSSGSSPSRRNGALILANSRAMAAAIDLADHMDAAAILRMHDELMRPSVPEIAGRWRSEQVWIGGGDLGPHRAVFIPPHHERVPKAIDDLVAFMRRADLPVLAHAAVAHAQFETIHPFPDGNGRTGRALLHAMLRRHGLTRAITVPMSAGLLADIDAYFATLTGYRQGDVAPIVELLAEAAFRAIANGRQLVTDLNIIRSGWNERVKARPHARTWQVADLLLRQPVVNVALVARELQISPPNVYRVIEPLLVAGILVETTDRRRGRMWRSEEILRALDDFAARAGRRRRG